MIDTSVSLKNVTPVQAKRWLSMWEFPEQFWKIATKSQGLQPLKLNKPQRIIQAEYDWQMRTRGFVRINVLKCRQSGITTYGTRLATHFSAMNAHSTCLTVAHQKELPSKWLAECRRHIEETPPGVLPSLTGAVGHLVFGNGSHYYIGSAQGGFPGMGDTIRFLHLSEIGRWDKPPISKNPDDVLVPLTPAIPTGSDIKGTVVLRESTGVMVGDWWNRTWIRGKDSDDEYTNIFLPWFLIETYRRDDMASTVLDYSLHELHMKSEAKGFGIELSDAQIAWYRNELQQSPYFGNENMFMAEYPSCEDEAFMAPGQTVYEALHVIPARETIREPIWRGNLLGPPTNPFEAAPQPAQHGEMEIWEWPNEINGKRVKGGDLHYALGADCMWGKRKESDWDVLYVECLETNKLVAKLKTQTTLDYWGWKIAAVGHFYNDCPVAPETNGQEAFAGYSVINILKGNAGNWAYPNIWVRTEDIKLKSGGSPEYGWDTSHASKQQIINFSMVGSTDGSFDWCDSESVDQMATIIRHLNNTIGAPEGMHDDCWMARMITAQVAHKCRAMTDLWQPPLELADVQVSLSDRVKEMLYVEEDKDEYFTL